MKIEQIKTILSSKTIGVAGCGGLGSNCAMALTRAGVGKLVIADFDIVDASNLTRQYYFHNQIGQDKVFALKENLKEIDSSIEIIPFNRKLEAKDILEIYADCDVVIEAFDRADMKQMIIETMANEFADKPLIVGSGMAGWGNNNNIVSEQIDENLYVCGDGKSEVSDELPPLAPRVGIVAYMQANLALSILLKNVNYI